MLCVVVEAPGDSPRSVRVRPNKKIEPLRHGDEEIQLLDLREGDAYDMDEDMQRGYEHCVPKRKNDKSHRFVLIFRQGRAASISEDSGVALSDLSKLDDEGSGGVDDSSLLSSLSKVRIKPPASVFGHHQSVHEAQLYGRRSLFLSGAHRSDQVGANTCDANFLYIFLVTFCRIAQRGVNGNMKSGCDSVVVSRQAVHLREEDGLSWLRYTSSRRQGGGALLTSYRGRKPVRVFRSSKLASIYAPPEQEGKTSYRYDGICKWSR